MFERYAPSAPQTPQQERKALRAFGWSELTVRINAARDLRRILRSDSLLEASSFADAAGGYFVSEGNGKRVVKRDSLESSNILGGKQEVAGQIIETGDRESK